jgi:hypothetical protein
MDRRQHPRSDSDLAVSLSYPPLGLLQTRILNISDSGVFVHSSTIRLNLYAAADIIQCRDRSLTPIRVQVERVSGSGAGLSFVDPDPSLIRRLRAAFEQPAAAQPQPLRAAWITKSS